MVVAFYNSNMFHLRKVDELWHLILVAINHFVSNDISEA